MITSVHVQSYLLFLKKRHRMYPIADQSLLHPIPILHTILISIQNRLLLPANLQQPNAIVSLTIVSLVAIVK